MSRVHVSVRPSVLPAFVLASRAIVMRSAKAQKPQKPLSVRRPLPRRRSAIYRCGSAAPSDRQVTGRAGRQAGRTRGGGLT